MLKSYIKIAFRSLRKNKIFTFINIIGLSFGMICFIFIALWVSDELKFDRFHTDGENIYKILAEKNVDKNSHIVPYTPSALIDPIVNEVPEIENIARAFPSDVVFNKQGEKWTEKGLYTDAAFFKIFNFPLKEGDAKKVLQNPNTIVITSELAEKYFPNQSALGQHLEIIQKEPVEYVVTGVLESIPSHSSLQFDFLLSYQVFENTFRPWWKSNNPSSFTNFNVTTYIEVHEDVKPAFINKKLNKVFHSYSQATADELFVYPFEKLYLQSDFSEGRQPTGKLQYVLLMATVGVVILLIACINFINLSIVAAGKRRLEAGLRKVVGANKRQIMMQFLTESVIISFIALVLAVTTVEIFLPFFNTITLKSIEVPFSSPLFLLSISIGSVIVGLLAGCYPALKFSSFEIFNTEKNQSLTGFSGFKKVLVVIQFSCSIVFIAFTIIVFQQVNFIKTKPLGLETENIIQHPLNGIRAHQEAYKTALLNIPAIQSVSFTEQDPIGTANRNNGVQWQGKPEEQPVFFNVIQVSEDFLETFNIKLLEGKNFSTPFRNNQVQFIVNQQAVKQFMKDEVVGLELSVWGNQGQVIGVVEDYHHQSLLQKIEPLVLICNTPQTWNAYIGYNGENTQTVLKQVQKVYEMHESSHPFAYSFVDDQFESQYSDITNIGNLGLTFTAAAILISCLGLFGLSAFVMQQRLKETSIRKVLGADTIGLIYSFSFDFIKLVLISICIALPISWYYSEQWLSGFAYHLEPGITPFIWAGISALSISLITVVYNTIKAAMMNPVDTLKDK